MPGVQSARVHLSLPDPTRAQLDDATAAPPSASVLVVRRADHPVDSDAIATVVAGAVEQLARERVEVVVRAQPATRGAPPALARLGPITVTQESAVWLRTILATLLATNLLLALVIVAMVHRSRRRRRLD
jgi:type III secretory pathway lipoprotein EscJ